MPYWTLDEAVALSFGKAPEEVNWPKVEEFIERSDFAAEYQKRRELVLRAAASNQLSDPVVPAEFLGWAKNMELAVPSDLDLCGRGEGDPFLGLEIEV